MGDVAHDTMAAIELVTQLQKVRDLDPRERYQGDTDASSIYSMSTVDQSQAGTTTEADSEIPARPRMRRPKRTTHLSLDRVFRKRFHKLKKELEVGAIIWLLAFYHFDAFAVCNKYEIEKA